MSDGARKTPVLKTSTVTTLRVPAIADSLSARPSGVKRNKENRVKTLNKTDAMPAATAVRAEERHRMIAEAAYYIAVRRGFASGSPEQDWYEAEARVDQLLNAPIPRPSTPTNGA